MIRVPVRPAGRPRGRARPGHRAVSASPGPLVLTEDRWAGRISAGDFTAPVEALARHPGAEALQPPLRRRRAGTWPPQLQRRPELDRARRAPRAAGPGTGGEDHRARPSCAPSCAGTPATRCPEREEHARWAERRWRLERDTEALRGKVASRTGSLARTFDRVCALLTGARLPRPPAAR